MPDVYKRQAQLVAENIASQLERRISFRRAMKQCIGRTMKLGAQGIKVQVSGRLGGAEIARSEHYHEGTIPVSYTHLDVYKRQGLGQGDLAFTVSYGGGRYPFAPGRAGAEGQCGCRAGGFI